jgi:TolB-like protein/Flp pilus assembly protein TadD
MTSLVSELKRRNVFRVAVLYGIVAWVLIQVVDVVMPRLGIPEWGVTLVIVLLVIGFPVAMLFAWAFELTPEGVKRTGDVDPEASITPDTGQKLNNMIIGVLGIAVAYLLVDKFFLGGAPEPGTSPETVQVAEAPVLTSIAVLPFADMSPDKDQEYFTDGISEELLNLLAKIPDFKVAGRTSSFAFKGKNDDLRIIGEKLGVATILEGSVRKQKNQIRVTAQLIKVDDGYHLWSETYDRRLDDVFAIQDEIATEVVGALKQTLLGDEDRAVIAFFNDTATTEIYTAYLRGRHIMRIRNEENLYKALREFRHATEVDPEFAPAWAGVANAYSLLASYEFRTDAEVLPLAEDAVEKALSLDPGLGEAWGAKGLVLMQRRGRNEEAIEALEKAVEFSPSNVEMMMWLASQFNNTFQYEKAAATYRKAYEIDPLFPVLLSNLVSIASSTGDRQSAVRYLSELESVAPAALNTYRARAMSAWAMGQMEDNFRILRQAYASGAVDMFLLGLLADRALDYGDVTQAAGYSEAMKRINPLAPWATTIDAAIAHQAGREQQAAEILDRALLRQPDDELLAAIAGAFAIMHGEADAARSLLDAGLKSDPANDYWRVDNVDSLIGSAWLLEIYLDRGEADAAGSLYRIASREAASMSLGTGEDWYGNYLQARLEGGMGNVDEMKRLLEKAIEQGGHSLYFSAWDTMLLKYTGDPEVAQLLNRFDAGREEARRALIAEDLIAETAEGAGT